MQDLSAYYFTYGSDKSFPYQSGWTMVLAQNRLAAVAAFDVYHPRSESAYGCVNCADIYEAEEFEATKMYHQGNRGGFCQEVITLSRVEPTEVAVNE